MATFGRIENGVVMEVITAIDQKEINSKFHKTIAAQFVKDSSGLIKPGWIYDGESFAVPAPVVPTIDQIKSEAGRRIVASGHDWMAARQTGDGAPMPQTIKDYAAAIRTDSATLEESLPEDYTNDSHWTKP